MKVLLCVITETLQESEVALAYLGRAFRSRLRPLTMSDATHRRIPRSAARFVELELPGMQMIGGLAVVEDADIPPTCLILAEWGQPVSILCLRCGAWSSNLADVEQEYCPRCGVFHREYSSRRDSSDRRQETGG